MGKEIGPTSLTANLSAIYEFGGGIDNEFESAAALQWRRRYAEKFETAVEYHAGDDLAAVGPGITSAASIATPSSAFILLTPSPLKAVLMARGAR